MKTAAHLLIAIALSLGARGHGGVDTTPPQLPKHLSEAGLFVEGSVTEIRAELMPFVPQYALWSDGATKRRWIDLPSGTFIDAKQPDAWQFPPGTRFWKEFSLERRVETRLIERLADGSWRYATYVWNEAGTDAVLAPAEGIRALPIPVGRGRYAIPSVYDCHACHEGGSVPVLGFSALQLSPDRDPAALHAEPPADRPTLDLRELVARGWLRNLPELLIENPPRIATRSPTERAALGYLHANCGHCHSNPAVTSAAVPVGVRLALEVADPTSADEVLRSLIGAPSRFRPASAHATPALVVPGRAHDSVLTMRMRSRDPRVQMPPLGTQLPDSAALALIERWIDHHLERKEL